MQSEYKCERFTYGLLGAMDSRSFDQSLTTFLNERAGQGWELKGCFHDFGHHVHLVFAKPVGGEENSA